VEGKVSNVLANQLPILIVILTRRRQPILIPYRTLNDAQRWSSTRTRLGLSSTESVVGGSSLALSGSHEDGETSCFDDGEGEESEGSDEGEEEEGGSSGGHRWD